jgi:hypothetical protein
MDDFKTVHRLAGQVARQPASLRASQGPSPQSLVMIGAEISRLLSHYWTTNEDQKLREAQARDWLTDLRDFPAEIVAEACGNWRRGENRRPMISDIRQRCIEEVERRRPRMLPPPRSKAPEAYSGEYVEAAAARAAWAKARGLSSFADALAMGIQTAGKIRPL